MITNLVSTAILNLFKDSLNFNWFTFCNVLSKLEVILSCYYNDTSCKYAAKHLEKE